jgi:hypothetical protein
MLAGLRVGEALRSDTGTTGGDRALSSELCPHRMSQRTDRHSVGGRTRNCSAVSGPKRAARIG